MIPQDVVRQTLLLAIAEVQGLHPHRFVRCHVVLYAALRLLGVERQQVGDLADERIPIFGAARYVYLVLVDEVRRAQLIEGQGNFGDGETVAAHPSLVECRLTAVGRERIKTG
jgi:hypothetical protein